MLRPCSGCRRTFAASGLVDGRCPSCQRARDAARNAAPARAIYRGTWPTESQAARDAQPWCSRCGKTTDLTVDHGPSGLGRTVLCRSCHSSVENDRRRSPEARPVWHGRELIALMGAPGSGKSTYAQRYPRCVTTDALREIGPRAAGAVYQRAFDAAAAVLRANQQVVFDAPLAKRSVRLRLLRLATAYKARAVVVFFDTPLDVCLARQQGRARPVPADTVRRLHAEIASQRSELEREGWSQVITLTYQGGFTEHQSSLNVTDVQSSLLTSPITLMDVA